MSSLQRTLTLANHDSGRTDGPRTLVQIYPLNLNQGPLELKQHVTTIGRSSGCDLQITDDSVSRRHAEIRVTDRGPVLLDLASTNGVSVNGTPVELHSLVSGDCIQIGTHVFRFLADDDLESQYHATVYSMMTRDGLTGIYNERYLEETMDREVARCKRYSRPLAVVMIDIDDFKSTNDQYGHLIGDQVIAEVATRLQNVLREDDVLARCGGEEFAILMVEARLEDVVEIAERCRIAVMAEPIESTAGAISVTISLGVTAPEPRDLGTREELLRDADARLYDAKRMGRNRVVC